MQIPQPSQNFRNIVALLPTLTPVELVFLYTMMPGFMAKGSLESEEFQLVPSGEELATRVLKVLKSPETLTGPENALLAAVLTQYGAQYGLGSDEAFESRTVTQELRRENRTISNITSVMDSLVEKGFVENLDEGKKGTHREYRVTTRGCAETLRVCRRCEEKSPESVKVGVA